MMLVFLFFVSGVATLALALAAAGFDPRLFWAAAVAAWVWSFLGSFSIGLYTLMSAHVFLVFALGNSLGLLRRVWHFLPAAGAGVGIWWLLVSYVDRQWLFFPLSAVLGGLE